jgi:hypothetical protein
MGFNEILILLFLAIILFDFFALRDLLRSQFINPPIKLYYLLVILFLPVLGPVIYFTSASRYKVV